jgi:hypothetical protein
MSEIKIPLAKLVYESAYDDQKVTLEFVPGINIHDFMDEVFKLALAIGYHTSSVEEGFIGKAEEIETTREQKNKSEE